MLVPRALRLTPNASRTILRYRSAVPNSEARSESSGIVMRISTRLDTQGETRSLQRTLRAIRDCTPRRHAITHALSIALATSCLTGCVKSGESNRDEEIGLPPVADTLGLEVNPIQIEGAPSHIDAAVKWAIVFPGVEMALVRATFEDWGDVGFVRVYECKSNTDRRGEVILRIPELTPLVDAKQARAIKDARSRGATGYTFDRIAAAEHIWSQRLEPITATADSTIGRYGDPFREDRILRVLWARLDEVKSNNGHHKGWFAPPYNGDANAWLASASRRFNREFSDSR